MGCWVSVGLIVRRTLLVAIIGVVAAALVFADIGTIVLIQRAARDRARQDLVEQAQAFATASIGSAEQARTLELVRRVARAQGAQLVRISADGTAKSKLPQGLSLSSLAVDKLAAGEAVSGIRGRLVFAAAPLQVGSGSPLPQTQVTVARLPRGRNRLRSILNRQLLPSSRGVRKDVTTAVVLTREVTREPIGAGYLFFTALFALGFAAVIAIFVSRRISRHVNRAVEATQRIANGELDAAIDVRDDDYPELASLALSINSMASSLARSKDLERQFLMSVSHDLRTPLTSIRGYAEALADGVTHDTKAAGEVIQSEARRLERLVADLLELAKLDARSFTLNPVPLDIGVAVLATARGFVPAAARADLRLDIGVPSSPLQCELDPDRLAQIVANLIENAMNYAATNVTVTVETRGVSAAIVVQDDGPGISESALSQVFERFYQAPREASRQVGSGLGLAIVAELIRTMHGQVQVESPVTDQRGTRIVVQFRLA